jgi:Flp pilus assembly protein TadD
VGELSGIELDLAEAERLAAARMAAGRHAAAVELYGQIVAALPDHAAALLALGGFALEARRPAEAVALLERAAAGAPEDVIVQAHLGGAFALLDRTGEAEELLRRAVRLDARCALAHRNLGLTLHRQGRLADAAAAIRRARDLDPGDLEAKRLLAGVLLDQGEAANAATLYRSVLNRAPRSAAAHAGLAAALERMGDAGGAVAALASATALGPADPQPRLALGRLLLAGGEAAAAVDPLREATALLPDEAAPQAILAEALILDQQIGEAARTCERAISLAPQDPQALLAFGALLDALDRPADAVTVLRQAQARAPASPVAGRRLAEMLLKSGDFAAGWPAWEQLIPPGDLPYPPWRGEPLPGRRILVEADACLEDNLLMLRLLPALAAAGARVVVRCAPELQRLLVGLAGDVELVAPGDTGTACDFAVPMRHLPRLLALDLQNIPPALGCLRPLPERGAAWSTRIAALPAPRIGLVWRTGTGRDPRSRLPLACLHPLIRYRPGSFLAFNAEDRRDEILAAGLAGHIIDLGAEFAEAPGGPWPEMLAALDCIDLLIAVDSPAAHLAGLLGRPAWVLLAQPADWRWFRGGAESPWYPTLRLMRQSSAGDWASVVDAAVRRLAGEDAA